MIGTYSTFGEARRRRRRSFYWRVLRFLLTVVAVSGVGGYGYQVGVSANQARTDKLEADLARFQQSNLDLRDRLALTAERFSQAEAALDELRRRYAEQVPQDELAELLSRIEAQLQDGVEPERLAFLIDAAGVTESCADAPVTKRFMPRTPVSTGPVSYVRFADRITVTGAGEPVLSAEGLPEAWYDPASPVRIDFQTLDGEVVGVEGIVPFTHNMVVDRQEYRFSAVAGERGFVEITAQVCALPGAPSGDGDAADELGREEAGPAEIAPIKPAPSR
jgi:cell division protein FtsB